MTRDEAARAWAAAASNDDRSVEYFEGREADPTSIPWSDEYGVGVFRIVWNGVGSNEVTGFERQTADSEEVIYLPAPDAALPEMLEFVGRVAVAIDVREFAIESPTYRAGDESFRVTFWPGISGCPGDAPDLCWAALLAALAALEAR